MTNHRLTEKLIREYLEQLCLDERSPATIRRYEKTIWLFYLDLPEDKLVNKALVLKWKGQLTDTYAASTVNVMLSGLNGLFAFCGWDECHVKPLKCQRRVFQDVRRELTRADYLKLLDAAKMLKKERLYLLMETLCATGIRVSELQYITVEALSTARVNVNCKGKQRVILLTKKLAQTLREYCRRNRIECGPVFVTRTGKPLDRANIWRELKTLCNRANVDADKVFPHNFRHLFAVAFYRMSKDIAKLADLLGHASIETTRIYIMESSREHERQLSRLSFIL